MCIYSRCRALHDGIHIQAGLGISMYRYLQWSYLHQVQDWILD